MKTNIGPIVTRFSEPRQPDSIYDSDSQKKQTSPMPLCAKSYRIVTNVDGAAVTAADASIKRAECPSAGK
jgi:hypothetical protein